RDPLPLSPLFSPDNIARYFGIRWTDGTTTLLTWSGPDTTPLDEAWVREYRRAVAQAEWLGRFPNAEMRAVFERLRATPRPWRSVELPWQSGATRGAQHLPLSPPSPHDPADRPDQRIEPEQRVGQPHRVEIGGREGLAPRLVEAVAPIRFQAEAIAPRPQRVARDFRKRAAPRHLLPGPTRLEMGEKTLAARDPRALRGAGPEGVVD